MSDTEAVFTDAELLVMRG